MVPAWIQGFTGKGVVVAVVDDGMYGQNAASRVVKSK